jgi:hypothetical protein
MAIKYMEEMLYTSGHKENANQNHINILPHSSQNGCHQEHNNNVGENSGGKGTLMCCWWERKLGQPLWKTVCMFLKN